MNAAPVTERMERLLSESVDDERRWMEREAAFKAGVAKGKAAATQFIDAIKAAHTDPDEAYEQLNDELTAASQIRDAIVESYTAVASAFKDAGGVADDAVHALKETAKHVSATTRLVHQDNIPGDLTALAAVFEKASSAAWLGKLLAPVLQHAGFYEGLQDELDQERYRMRGIG